MVTSLWFQTCIKVSSTKRKTQHFKYHECQKYFLMSTFLKMYFEVMNKFHCPFHLQQNSMFF